MSAEAKQDEAIEAPPVSFLDVAFACLFALPTCALSIYLASGRFSYLDGLGKKPGSIFNEMMFLLLAVILFIVSIIVLSKMVRGTGKLRTNSAKWILYFLFIATLIVPMGSCVLREPGYKPYMRGFARQIQEKFILSTDARNWVQEELRKNNQWHYLTLKQCPDAVNAMIKNIQTPWGAGETHWTVYFAGDGLARFETSGGLTGHWGIGVFPVGNSTIPIPQTDALEYRIPINSEVFVYNSLH